MTRQEAVRTMLLAVPKVVEHVGAKVYHGQSQQRDEYPYITFSFITARRVKSLAGDAGLGSTRVQIDVWGFGTTVLEDIVRDIYERCQGGQHADPLWVWHEDESDGVEPPPGLGTKGLRRATLDLTVWR